MEFLIEGSIGQRFRARIDLLLERAAARVRSKGQKFLQGCADRRRRRDLRRVSRELAHLSDHMRRDLGLPSRCFTRI
jgi:hypothetical protein